MFKFYNFFCGYDNYSSLMNKFIEILLILTKIFYTVACTEIEIHQKPFSGNKSFHFWFERWGQMGKPKVSNRIARSKTVASLKALPLIKLYSVIKTTFTE